MSAGLVLALLVAEFVSKGSATVVRQVEGQAGKLMCSSGLGSHALMAGDVQSRGTAEGHMGMAAAQLETIPLLIQLRAEPKYV